MINLKDDGAEMPDLYTWPATERGSNRAIMQRQERAENRRQMKTKNMDKTGGGAGPSANGSCYPIKLSPYKYIVKETIYMNETAPKGTASFYVSAVRRPPCYVINYFLAALAAFLFSFHTYASYIIGVPMKMEA